MESTSDTGKHIYEALCDSNAKLYETVEIPGGDFEYVPRIFGEIFGLYIPDSVTFGSTELYLNSYSGPIITSFLINEALSNIIGNEAKPGYRQIILPWSMTESCCIFNKIVIKGLSSATTMTVGYHRQSAREETVFVLRQLNKREVNRFGIGYDLHHVCSAVVLSSDTPIDIDRISIVVHLAKTDIIYEVQRNRQVAISEGVAIFPLGMSEESSLKSKLFNPKGRYPNFSRAYAEVILPDFKGEVRALEFNNARSDGMNCSTIRWQLF